MKITIAIILCFITQSCFGENNTIHDSLTLSKDTFQIDEKYKLTATYLNLSTDDFIENLVAVQLIKLQNNKDSIVFKDTVPSFSGIIEFIDFNNENKTDILVQHSSSARSNIHYTLYRLDTMHHKLIKIKGFEDIPNPRYVPKYDIIDCYALTGINWTNFYSIKNDSIIDYNLIIEDDLTRKSGYYKNYKKAIKKVLEIQKKL